MAGYTALLEDVRRRVSESADPTARRLASKFGYLKYMVVRYYEMLGSWDRVEELLEAFEKPLPRAIRVNTLRFGNPREVIERLERLGYRFSKIPWEHHSYVVTKAGGVSLGATHEFLLGGYYLYRGVASLIPPLALSPEPSDVVLDAAAAPGGKTTHIAQLMGNRGVVVAADISRERFRALRSNLERMGVENVVALRVDSRKIPEIFGEYFSKSLLDSPCTGEGIIQVDPTRKTKTLFEDLARAHRRQVELLTAVVRSTAPGGLVAYTTCSIAPEENEFTVAEVLESVGGVRVVKPAVEVELEPGIVDYFGIRLPEQLSLCGRTYPHTHGFEGFFVCVLEKIGP
ncbi:MAG: RsmB/NOP family class I SAM-dependent RNA methyltransferase [Sulfolobales archaeon]|nr:RsmB/NOP family class I SAM-dependent RNA methyltransferase [Sulfolobales archaeon]MCX8209101.1 RsmB/NOP family class I SAM-dependent RNA methyltransferase [Sulfolobales archaeon]MDW8010257.1 RsmB/NOP family class I SAM-dependent RNA methyltransferase [Sulfolobales archaeon]